MSTIHPLKRTFDVVWNIFLDILAPQDPLLRTIEDMTPLQFMEKVKLARKDASPLMLYFFRYQEPLVKRAILEVKSYGNQKIANLLGNVLSDLLVEELADLKTFKNFENPLLLPIPITKRVLRKRGWNQSELIARALCKTMGGISIELKNNVLVKTRDTGDQVGKSRAERFRNLEGCFEVINTHLLKGRNIIIFDDITTTGATFKEARKALRKAGVKKILCVAIAH